MTTFTPRVFSGMQPTGNLHLGNYLGAMLNWIKLQETHESIYCVVDMHAITLWQEPKELHKAILEVTAAYLACGLDPKRSIIFNQSQVQEHAELAWIFNCVARMGWLNRMTQFKEKAGKDKEQASVGLYVYPDLMAADILAYKGTHVPVGEDQNSIWNWRAISRGNSTWILAMPFVRLATMAISSRSRNPSSSDQRRG